MPWDDGLLDEQRDAAGHVGSHARLLAGPGTGKTHVIARRVSFLIMEHSVDPERVVVLTFTRAAASELRKRVVPQANTSKCPRVSTLHAFALRQLVRNSARIDALPQPLRIADDWEERHIILQDIKEVLELNRISDARELFTRLAADWETLAAAEPDWDPDPAFIGAWQRHRRMYGYTLRAELVYQLKRALEQYADFELEQPIEHLVVDEYQDLNKCDLAIIRTLADRGAEIFAAGDDDQSIYGFRKAFPEGIRRFPKTYTGSRDLPLEVCHRCDPEILRIGAFVAGLDPDRIEKRIRAEKGKKGGNVSLLRFPNQGHEAAGVAEICRYLIDQHGYLPHDFLVLLRSDWRGSFSDVLIGAFQAQDLDAAAAPDTRTLLDEPEGRSVLATLRLCVQPEDDLAWRSLLDLRSNRIGERTLKSIAELTGERGLRFCQALNAIADEPCLLARHGPRVKNEVDSVREVVAQAQTRLETSNISDAIAYVISQAVEDEDVCDLLHELFDDLQKSTEAQTLPELLSGMESVGENLEQELEPDAINILTMHRAKGLTAKAVFIVAAEDEHIPGRQQGGDAIGDERRLLYVSLTRAKHYLFVTYCEERTGRQKRLGSGGGTTKRTLTQFLRDAPIRPMAGANFLESFIE